MHREFVYILKSGPHFKIGRTVDLSKRIAQLKIQLPFEVELFKVINTDDCAKLEQFLHRVYAHFRVNGEWFDLSPHDATMLMLFPCSIACDDSSQMRESWNQTLGLVTEVLEQRARDKTLEQFISEETDMVGNEIPDHFGGALVSDYLAHECPYPPGADDMEWLVADTTEEE